MAVSSQADLSSIEIEVSALHRREEVTTEMKSPPRSLISHANPDVQLAMLLCCTLHGAASDKGKHLCQLGMLMITVNATATAAAATTSTASTTIVPASFAGRVVEKAKLRTVWHLLLQLVCQTAQLLGCVGGGRGS